MTASTIPTRERTIRNIFFGLASQILTLATSFFTTPIIVKKLGLDAYGIVILLSTILSYMNFISAGLSGATIQYLTECVSAGDWERFRQILWSSFITYLSIGLVGGTVLFLLTPTLISSWFSIPLDLRSVSATALYIFILIYIVSLTYETLKAIAWAYNRIDLSALLSLASGMLQPIGAMLMVLLGYGIIGVSIATLATNIVVLILGFLIARKLYRNWGRPTYNMQIMKPLFMYGGWINITYIVNQAVQFLDKVFIGSYLNSAAVGYYNLSVTIPLNLRIIHGAFASSAFPLIVNLRTRAATTTEIFHLLSRFARSTQLLLLPAVLFFTLWGDTFLSAWISDEVAENGKMTIRLASMAMLLVGTNAIHHIFLRAWGRSDLDTAVYTGNAVAYIPVLYLLIRWLGISGAGWALLFCSIVEMFLILNFVKRLVNIPISAWFPVILNRHVIILTTIGIPLRLMQSYLAWSPLWKLALFGGMFLILSSVYVWFIGFSKSDRDSILKTILGRFM